MTALILWFKGIKNMLFAAIAGILGFFVLWFRFSAARFERKAKEMKGKAERAEEQAKGYEVAHTARTRADKAVEAVRAERAATPKPRRRTGLEGQE